MYARTDLRLSWLQRAMWPLRSHHQADRGRRAQGLLCQLRGVLRLPRPILSLHFISRTPWEHSRRSKRQTHLRLMQFRPRLGKGNPARRCTPRRNPNRGCGGQLRRNRITDARRSIAFDPPRVPRACGRDFLETRWVSTSPVRAVPVSPHVVRPLVEAHDIRRDLQGTRVARQPHWFERRIPRFWT